jgi:site-specific DNA recombinase
MNHTDIKCFEYSRKSSEGEDRQVQSIERQEEENQMTIKHYGLNVIARFSESRSAKIPNNRPEFDCMLKRIRKGEAKGIICWHLNRLARNPEEAGKIQQMLSDGVIKAIYTRDRIYLPSDNLLLFSIESGMSAQYSIDLSHSIRSGLEKKLRDGIAPLFARIGYLNTKFGESGTNYITIDPERFHLVKKMWEMILSGSYTPSQILEIATNEWGLRTTFHKKRGGRSMSLSLLYRMFGDSFYAGYFVYKGKTYKGAHEPMVTLEQFDKVQMLLGRKDRPRSVKHTFTYTGIMKCPECGCSITATKKTKIIKSNGEERTYIFYHCTRKRAKIQKCNQGKGLREDNLEKEILKELTKISISAVLYKWAMDYLHTRHDAIIEQEEAIEEAQRAEISKLQNEIKRLLQLHLNEAISDVEYRNERTIREGRILRLQDDIGQKKGGTKSLFDEHRRRYALIRELADEFTDLAPKRKKEILLEIGSNHGIKDKKLLFSKHNWLEPVAELKDLIEAKIVRLEPEKNLMPQQKKELFALLSRFCGV